MARWPLSSRLRGYTREKGIALEQRSLQRTLKVGARVGVRAALKAGRYTSLHYTTINYFSRTGTRARPRASRQGAEEKQKRYRLGYLFLRLGRSYLFLPR